MIYGELDCVIKLSKGSMGGCIIWTSSGNLKLVKCFDGNEDFT